MKSTKNTKSGKTDMFFDEKNNRISTAGLTIIELLVTITILVATVTTVLALGDRAVSQAGLFTTYTQATFLAKEGVEILSDDSVRGAVENGESYWTVDYKGELVGENNINDCRKKMRTSEGDFYSYSGDDEAIFSRCITAWNEEDKMKIKVDVSFDYKNSDYNVTLYRIFYE